jgi:MFS family permease
MFLTYARFQGSIFLLTLFLQAERGMSPLEAGLTSFPTALGVMVMMPWASRAYRALGPRRVLLLGLLTGTGVSLSMLAVDLETSRWWLRGIQLLWGMTFAVSIVPLNTATFAGIAPVNMGQASAAFNSIRQVGGSFGVALLATVLSSRLGHDGAVLGEPATRAAGLSAFHDTWVVAASLAIIAGAFALLIEDRLAAATFGPAVKAKKLEVPVVPEEALVA